MAGSPDRPTVRDLRTALSRPALTLAAGAALFGVGLIAARPCLRTSPSPCADLLQWGIFVIIVVGTAALTIALAWAVLLIAGWVTDRRGYPT